MLENISFGKYIPLDSIIHRMDPRFKLMLLLAIIVFIFVAANYFALGLMLIFSVALMLASKIKFKMFLSNVKPILPIILITSILSAIYVKTGVAFTVWKITIYSGAIDRIVFMVIRISLLIIISSLLSYTTSPTSLTSALESLLSPLKYIGLKNAVHTMAMTMTIALRFIPTLIEETIKIMNAQKARGADFESGGILKKVKALLPVLVPLLISSVRRAEELANAMECRCYSGADGRTRYKKLTFGKIDILACFCCVLIFTSVILMNYYL